MIRKGSFLKRRILCSVLRVLPSEKRIASADYAQDPPVPIPNTEVKLSGAENTCLETDREDRLVLALLFFICSVCFDRIALSLSGLFSY